MCNKDDDTAGTGVSDAGGLALRSRPRASPIVPMKTKCIGGRVGAFLGLLAVASPRPAWAGAIPSKAAEDKPASAPDASLAKVRDVLARNEVAKALAAHGLSQTEVERRLVELSPEDLRPLAANVDQVQAAGSVPNYIWILLGILLAVSILAAVF